MTLDDDQNGGDGGGLVTRKVIAFVGEMEPSSRVRGGRAMTR